MKETIEINNESPCEAFESRIGFKSVVINKITYSNMKDTPTLLFNWIHGNFGEVFSIPISVGNIIKNYDLIKSAKNHDVKFMGPFLLLDIKLRDDFKHKRSSVIIEVEID